MVLPPIAEMQEQISTAVQLKLLMPDKTIKECLVLAKVKEDHANDKSMQQRIRRLVQKKKKEKDSAAPDAPKAQTTAKPAARKPPPSSAAKRNADKSLPASSFVTPTMDHKKTRRSTAQVMSYHRTTNELTQNEKNAMAAAVKMYGGGDLSSEEVAAAINKQYGSTLCPRTIRNNRQREREGRVANANAGRPKTICHPNAYEALKVAYATCIKLRQANAMEESTFKTMTALVAQVLGATSKQRDG